MTEALITTIIFGVVNIVLGIFYYFNNLRLKKAEAEATNAKQERADAKKELGDLKKSVSDINDVQKINVPAFQDLLKEAVQVKQTIQHHEQRFEGVLRNIERMGDKYDNKFEVVDKDVREIKDCIKEIKKDFKDFGEKVENKMEATTKEIMAAIKEIKK